jgi:alkylation response protein AidB-like acyl-CoA dehydrogenase
MDFKFDEKAEKFRKEIRKFVKEELPPDHIGLLFAEEHFDELWDLSMQTSKKLAERGWLAISWPKEFGGMGASFWEQVLFKVEVGYWGIPGTGMGIGGTSWVGPTLMLMGTEAQKKKYLPPIAAGDEEGIWCTGYSEPDAGSDLASLQTHAQRDGDEYVINGQKIWNSAGHRARWCWLACRTDLNNEKKHQGISLIIVDMQSDGITVRPIPNMIGYNVFNEIFFKDVRVPAENLVGVENEGWGVLMTALAFERTLGLGYSGALQRVLDELVVYAREQGLMDRAEIRHKLAELAVDIRALQLNAYETAWKQSIGKNVIYEPSRDKVCATEIMEKIGRTGTEMLGAYAQIDPLQENGGYSRVGAAVRSMFWCASGMNSGGGTTETLRNIIARFGLHLPKTS